MPEPRPRRLTLEEQWKKTKNYSRANLHADTAIPQGPSSLKIESNKKEFDPEYSQKLREANQYILDVESIQEGDDLTELDTRGNALKEYFTNKRIEIDQAGKFDDYYDAYYAEIIEVSNLAESIVFPETPEEISSRLGLINSTILDLLDPLE